MSIDSHMSAGPYLKSIELPAFPLLQPSSVTKSAAAPFSRRLRDLLPAWLRPAAPDEV